MKKFVWLLAFCIASLRGFTQETFVKLYPEGETSNFFRITQTTNGKLFLGGYDYLDDKAYPPTTTGNAWIASYTVFVEKTERVGYGIFEVDNIGDVRFDIPQNLPMP